DLDRSRLGGIAPEVTEPAQRVEVAVHGGRRRQPHRFADLADRRWIAAIASLGLDELEDLALTWAETLVGHVVIVRAFDARVKHLFVAGLDGDPLFGVQ